MANVPRQVSVPRAQFQLSVKDRVHRNQGRCKPGSFHPRLQHLFLRNAGFPDRRDHPRRHHKSASNGANEYCQFLEALARGHCIQFLLHCAELQVHV